MLKTLLVLLTAHLVGDFALQPDRMAKRKRDVKVLLLHVVAVTGASAMLLGGLPLPLLTALFAAHLLLDSAKVNLFGERAGMFLLDQLMHLVVIAALALVFPNAAAEGLWLTRLTLEGQQCWLQFVTLLGGVLLCVPTGGVLIGVLTRPFLEDIRQSRADQSNGGIDGLPKGGRFIGWLERSLVMMLFLMGQPEGIGFLVAAKSILRFGEIKDSHQRKMSEYIIIGTFMSFGWALLVAYLTQQILRFW